MPAVIGIDHLYIAVTDMAKSERFYDAVMGVLGFRKNTFALGAEPHVQYYNRHFGYVLRPARVSTPHNPYAAGLHHFCLRVDREQDVADAVQQLRQAGIEVSGPAHHPEYAPDYVAAFLQDPDGLRLEITNYRQERRERHDHWESTGK